MIDAKTKRNAITLLISWLYENEEYGDDFEYNFNVYNVNEILWRT